MNRKNVEQIIKDLAADLFRGYPDHYPLHRDISDETKEQITAAAEGYFAERTEPEIERDENLEISESDYIKWCFEEYEDLIANEYEQK
jgi:hypothetical protein